MYFHWRNYQYHQLLHDMLSQSHNPLGKNIMGWYLLNPTIHMVTALWDSIYSIQQSTW